MVNLILLVYKYTLMDQFGILQKKIVILTKSFVVGLGELIIVVHII